MLRCYLLRCNNITIDFALRRKITYRLHGTAVVESRLGRNGRTEENCRAKGQRRQAARGRLPLCARQVTLCFCRNRRARVHVSDRNVDDGRDFSAPTRGRRTGVRDHRTDRRPADRRSADSRSHGATRVAPPQIEPIARVIPSKTMSRTPHHCCAIELGSAGCGAMNSDLPIAARSSWDLWVATP